MAPPPSSIRSPSTRGRGRGRPRLRGRANSLLSGRRRTQTVVQPSPDTYTPTGRRRPVYQNGYRPGGAGGGGRYIDHSTGTVVPANVYNALNTPATAARGARRSTAMTTAAGSDGVYKPREEKSYTEFHPDLDVEQMLEVFSAEDVDGPNYKPPAILEKSVKIVDVKEEGEHHEDRRDGATMEKKWSVGHDGIGIGEMLDMVPEHGSSYMAYLNGTASMNDMDVDMEDAEEMNGIGTPSLTITTEGVEKPLHPAYPGIHADMAIDPLLAAMTPPPPPSIIGTELFPLIPIDPALSQVDLAPQTPAITPTEENASTQPSHPITPGPTRPSRRGDDGPTLASLRAHRSNAGKPPSRTTPLTSTVRRPRTTTTAPSFEAEKLNLPKPSYRKITPFQFSEFAWSSSVGSTGPYGLNNPHKTTDTVDTSMLSIGYQQTALYTRPRTLLRDRPDLGIDEELGSIDTRDTVEYDMDEQDDKWLTMHNSHRLLLQVAPVSREVFEITMTKIEKEWVALEKKIPKPPAKPHGANSRRRAGGQEDDEEGGEDSKCVICDDGECENSNAIVFCDGCNLAVHQECYGVPYIPEGQWLCRKCLTIPRQKAHCIFCPNTDGAFKQTTTTRWSHLLCAIWIPEVRLANPAYMEPVDGMELVPKSRWRLTCYICKQKMGACIQCSNKSCFIAFHVTCGRRARLHMKMKNTSGPGAQLEASGLKAYCDKHVPADWRRENDVDDAVADAMEFYAVTMAGRNWGDSQSAAMALPDPTEDNSPPNGILSGGNLPRVNVTFGNKRKRNQTPKPVWKLPSGAPVIPHVIYTAVVDFLARFSLPNRKEYVAEACKYWTLKREARRGASLLKRLQLQMNSFTSVEVTRKNYGAMGHTVGTKKLERRKEFAGGLMRELERLKEVTGRVEGREKGRIGEVERIKEYVDLVYFPEVPLMREVLEKVESLDRERVFEYGFALIKDRLENRLYPTIETFAMDITSVLNSPPEQPVLEWKINLASYSPPMPLGAKEKDLKDDSLGPKTAARLLEEMQPLLEEATIAEQGLHPATADSGEPSIFSRTSASLEDDIEIDRIGQNLTGTNGLVQSRANGSGGANETTVTTASPKQRKPPGGVNGVNMNMNMSVPLPAGTTVLGYWTAGHPPWYMKECESSGLDNVDACNRKTPTPTPRMSPAPPPPQRTEVVPKTPPKKGEGEGAENEDLMGGYRLEDLPSPLGTIDGENATPEKREGELPGLQGFVVANGVVDHENTSVLSDPSDEEEEEGTEEEDDGEEEEDEEEDEEEEEEEEEEEAETTEATEATEEEEDEDVDVDAEGSTEDEEVGMDRMDVDVDIDVDDEDLDADGEGELAESESGVSKSEGSPGSSSGGSGRKSRKGMVFARQSNGRFGPMKSPEKVGGGGVGGEGRGGGRGRGRGRKKW